MKYMGSKSRITKYIVPILQDIINKNNITTYIEPFVGGANVIDKISCNHKIGNDISRPLIALLTYVQHYTSLPDEVSFEAYSDVRANPDKYAEWFVGCVGFLASYNGRFFDGGYAKPGYEKTKTGVRYRDYYQESKRNLLEQSKQDEFKNIDFRYGDYIKLLEKLSPKGCLIYFDPPYINTKQYSNSGNFDYEKFWDIVRRYSKDNICIISELEAPDDFRCIWEKPVSRSIKATDKSSSVEKLFILNKGE